MVRIRCQRLLRTPLKGLLISEGFTRPPLLILDRNEAEAVRASVQIRAILSAGIRKLNNVMIINNRM